MYAVAHQLRKRVSDAGMYVVYAGSIARSANDLRRVGFPEPLTPDVDAKQNEILATMEKLAFLANELEEMVKGVLVIEVAMLDKEKKEADSVRPTRNRLE